MPAEAEQQLSQFSRKEMKELKESEFPCWRSGQSSAEVQKPSCCTGVRQHGIPGTPVPRSQVSRCAAATGPGTLPAQSASSTGQRCRSQGVQGQAEGCNGMHDLGIVRSDTIAWQTGHARLLTGLSGAAFPPTALSQLCKSARCSPLVTLLGPGAGCPSSVASVHVPFLSHSKV